MDSATVPAVVSRDLLTLTCVGIRYETPTIKTFSFCPDTPFDHAPGQALTLALERDGSTLHRTFSISSPPGRDRIDLTIKAQGAAGATRWMHDVIVEGTRILARQPRGHFVLSRRSSDRIAFVSAGSGATPLMAMLSALAAIAPEADVSWVHAARDPSEVLFAERLAALQAVMPNLKVSVVVSRLVTGWYGYRGRLTRRLMSVILPDFGRYEVFCCGPSPFMDEMKLIHAAEGGSKAVFHTETFGGPTATPVVAADGSSPPQEAPAFTLTIAGRSLDIRADESVLQASLRQGVIIPCGCGQGMCGTCLIRKVSGEVKTSYQGGIMPEEEAEGYILACSSRPLGNLEVIL